MRGSRVVERCVEEGGEPDRDLRPRRNYFRCVGGPGLGAVASRQGVASGYSGRLGPEVHQHAKERVRGAQVLGGHVST